MLLIHLTEKLIIKVKRIISCMKWWKLKKEIKKMISFEDAITKAYVFVSPLTCLIEFEEAADE